MKTDGMLYTWGYMGAKPADLMVIVERFNIGLAIDVRSVPRSRVAGFNRGQLETFLGCAYGWAGATLGGMGSGPTDSGLAMLAKRVGEGERLLIFCKEHAPGECHRHHTIALPLVQSGRLQADRVVHIFERELIEAGELQAAIDHDTEYDCETW